MLLVYLLKRKVALYKRMTDRYDIRHSLFDDFMVGSSVLVVEPCCMPTAYWHECRTYLHSY